MAEGYDVVPVYQEDMPHVILIGGRWDLDGGRPSKVFAAFARGFQQVFPHAKCLNGGDLSEIQREVQDLTVLVWFPDIPNEEDKLLGQLKQLHPRMTLVASKRLDGRNITLPKVVDGMLAAKVNLGLLIDRKGDQFRGQLIDPLGNLFASSTDFFELGVATAKRVEFISNVRRVRSEALGVMLERAEVPERFLSLIHDYAGIFDQLVPRPEKVSRFLGNAAFRCSHGFPAWRSKGGLIYVSQRNVDKSGINQDGFVPVKPFEPFDGSVQFFRRGAEKPSVDTPVNLLFFYRFPRINFLIHGHVYARYAGFTRRPVPCGAIEEFEEAMEVLNPGTEVNRFVLNLKGHGFIAGGHSIDDIAGLEFEPRPTLEPA